MVSSKMPGSSVPEYGIVDVWAHNLEEEFTKIRKVVQKYNYVAMVSEASGPCLNIKTIFPCMEISIKKIRWSCPYNGNPYTDKTTFFYIETAPGQVALDFQNDYWTHITCNSSSYKRQRSWSTPVTCALTLAVFKISAGPRTLTGKIWVGPASFPSLSYINIYKFWQNCASVRQVSDLILKTALALGWGPLKLYLLISRSGIFLFCENTSLVPWITSIFDRYYRRAAVTPIRYESDIQWVTSVLTLLEKNWENNPTITQQRILVY